MKNLKEILREKTIKYYNSKSCNRNMENFHMGDLFYILFNDVNNWPDVSYCCGCEDCNCDDSEKIKEELDMENNEILEINDNFITIACGGDWQNPLTLTIKAIDDKLTVVNIKNGYDDGKYWNKSELFLKDIGLDITTI